MKKFLFLMALSFSCFASELQLIQDTRYSTGMVDVVNTFKVGEVKCTITEAYVGANYHFCPTGTKIREARIVGSPQFPVILVYCFKQDIECEDSSR